MKQILTSISLIALMGSQAAVAAEPATSYPSKPVRAIVGYAPGGGSDIMGRIMAQELTKSFAGAANTAQQYPEYAQAIGAAARKSFLDGGDLTYTAGMFAVAIGICVVFFLFPKHDREIALLERYHAEDG